ncbi:flagellar filament capping protein FliD [Pantoea sp. 1.19]|uniref:flagellar filament capping protein FliD n=1 Tax=Pantoea sp. 1.19 TaxID=1925589 RepID=UPI0009490124|nr:flagellar filament capping protein FliD [Pantoea sp. 1.19]
MASVSSLGIGSNLPLDTLLTNLTTAEKGRLTPITQQQSSYSAKLTAYGSLKSALEKFQSANGALNNADLFRSTTVASSSDALTATTAAGAAAGKYTISVNQLAQAQSLNTAAQTSSSDKLGTLNGGTRTLTIQQDSRTEPLTLTLSDDQTSLTGIRDAINAADGGVSASIIKANDNSYQLVLTANDTGLKSQMNVSVEGDKKLNDLLAYDAKNSSGPRAMQSSVEAKNAQLTVNNIAIVRESNTVTDAPTGVTLTLNKTTENATVTVSKSTDKATQAIGDWVSAYNALMTTIGSVTAYSAADPGSEAQNASNGALLGDSVVRTIQAGLKEQFTNTQATGGLNTLSQLGITVKDYKTGLLQIDNDKLKDKLNNHAGAVMDLLVGDGKTSGVTTTTKNQVTSYLASDGIISSAQAGVNSTLKQLTKDYLSTSASIDDTIARYKAQFTQLDTLISSLSNTTSYLTQQFNAMNNSK